MDPSKWGSPTWTFFHSVGFDAPERLSGKQQKFYKEFYTTYISNLLPCGGCREHYKMWLKVIPINPFLATRCHLTYWIYIIHNLVRLSMGKHQRSYAKIVKKYEAMRAALDHKEIHMCIVKVKKMCLPKIIKILDKSNIHGIEKLRIY